MSDKEVRIRITGDVSDLQKKLKSIEDSLNNLGKGNSGNNKFVNSLIDDIGKAEKRIDELGDSLDDAADSFKTVGKNNGLDDMVSDISKINKELTITTDSFKDLGKGITSIDSKKLESFSQAMKEVAAEREDIEKVTKSLNDMDDMKNLKTANLNFGDTQKSIDEMKKNSGGILSDVTTGLISGTVAGKALESTFSDIASSIDKVTDSISEIKLPEKGVEYFKELSEDITVTEKKIDSLNKELDELDDELDELERINNNGSYDNEIAEKTAEYNKLIDMLERYENRLKRLQELENVPLDEYEKMADSYKDLEQAVDQYINTGENNVFLQEKLAKAFNETSQAMRAMTAGYEGKKDFKNLDLTEYIERSEKALENMKLVNLDHLERSFASLGDSVDDKTKKLTKLNTIFNDVSSESRRTAQALEEQADAIREYAEQAQYSVEVFKDADGKQQIKVIERTAEAAELARKKQEEYNEAIKEYLSLMRDSGGSISPKFLDDKGNFDALKYIKELDQYGKPLTQLTARFNVLRQQALEFMKDEEESVESKRKVIKACNDEAEALRKLGGAVKDISLDEIRNIDKSLATNLRDLFPEDIPTTFKDAIEDIKAAFTELTNLEFGNAMSLLKDVGKGIFAALPAEAKAAIVAITGVVLALNKLYDSGKRQFFEGLSNAVHKLQPVINAIQSFGREAITAFESITGTNIDLSSLMELGPNFEHQMAKVGAIAGSNSKQLGQLSDEAKRLGGTTQFTASQVGQAFEYMAMAGYTTEDMLNSINGVLNLSIASGTDLAKTSDIVTDYMTAMGMEASQTADFVDKLAATVTSSNTNVEQFGMSMKQVASQAGSLGITMTDLSTAIGLQANAGVKGSKAGTALKNILTNMASPTKKQAAALQKLGFAADETGSYFKLTADGAVDLEATVKQLMTSTDGMTRAQKAATLAQFAGREALPGLMALLSQGAEGWDELSSTIDNSTSKVQYWNECMSLAGKSGKEATSLIDSMKKVFADTEVEAAALGLSTEDLSHAIALLGDDGKVSSDNVKDLLNVIESMNTATGDIEEKWRALDKAGNDLVNTGFDYDATIAKLTADTTGLSQATKDNIAKQLEGVDTYEEANKILKEYGLTAERVSLESLSFADKLGYLRDNLKGCSDEELKSTLANLGLADSFDEVKEVMSMSDEEFKAYAKNLETVKTMTERLKETMDETTKASFLELASAIENVCIAAFEKIKPALKGATDSVNEFFRTWHNGDKNEFTWDGLEKGLSGLSDKVRQQEGNMKQAVVDLFASVNRFINGGSLKSILDMGTSVVQGICKGIQEAKGNGSLDKAIDGAIKNISDWITKNGPAIAEAGETILDSLTEGIKNNEGAITDAMNSICDIMTSWASSSGNLKSAAGLFAEQFVGLAVENMWIKFKSWIGEKFTAFGELFSGPFSIGGGAGGMAMNLWTNIMEGIFGVDPIGEMKDWIKKKLSNFHPIQWIKEQLFSKSSGKSGGGSKDKIKTEELINIPTLDEIKSHIKSKIGNFNIKDFIKGLLISGATLMGGPGAGVGVAGAIKVADLINIPTLGEIKEYITSKFSGFNIKEFIKTLLMGGATSMGGAAGAVGGALLKAADLFGEWNPVEDIKGWLDEKVGDWGITKWFKEKFGNKDGKGEKVKVSDLLELDTEKLADIETQLNSLSTTASTVSTNVVTAFNNITNTARTNFVNMANIVRNQMVNCANIVRNQAVNMANIVRNQALNMSNIFRNQFTSMANIARNQMVNVSNIVRNQAISWSNVIRNQVTNARNTFTSQFLSMAAVARTQMVNISNIIRNQAVSWSNVIRNQTANMKASFTAAFSGLSSIAASQMAKCLSTVRSYMSQIRAATAQTMTMNFRVNKTMTTTNITRNVTQGAARTMSNIARSGPSLIAPQAVTIGGGIVGGSDRVNNGLGSANALQLHIPLTVDGREIARATASYNQEELAKMSKRNSRRRGE